MSRERRYQQGKFEQYYPERNEVRGDVMRGDRKDFEVDRGDVRVVGSPPVPGRRGLHQGKGPRNYRRSDERILDDINDRLCDNPYIDASEIEVSVAEGNVVLSGTVENRASKRLAADIGESVSGVNNVENRLRVRVRGK